MRHSVLSTSVAGSRRNKELWKHVVAIVLETILTVSINTWLWRALGINLLIANKNDIFSGRCVKQGYVVH